MRKSYQVFSIPICPIYLTDMTYEEVKHGLDNVSFGDNHQFKYHEITIIIDLTGFNHALMWEFVLKFGSYWSVLKLSIQTSVGSTGCSVPSSSKPATLWSPLLYS